MPPSGYKLKQIKYINAFLDSCYFALKEEAKEKNFSVQEAIQNELNNIDFAVNLNYYAEISNIVMLLTRQFYQKLKDTDIQDWNSLEKRKAILLDDFTKTILKIDIESLLVSKG